MKRPIWSTVCIALLALNSLQLHATQPQTPTLLGPHWLIYIADIYISATLIWNVWGPWATGWRSGSMGR